MMGYEKVFLARGWLSLMVQNPSNEKWEREYIHFMNNLTAKDKKLVRDDAMVKSLIRRWNR